jgi:hypothetical protein
MDWLMEGLEYESNPWIRDQISSVGDSHGQPWIRSMDHVSDPWIISMD